jgi:hypothetical protein
MAVDGRGLEMSGSAAAVAAYDQAVGHLIRFQPEVVEASAAAAEDPGCALAGVFCAGSLLPRERAEPPGQR